jgi:hypothetical protein
VSVLVAVWTVVGVLAAVFLIHVLLGKFHTAEDDEFR